MRSNEPLQHYPTLRMSHSEVSLLPETRHGEASTTKEPSDIPHPLSKQPHRSQRPTHQNPDEISIDPRSSQKIARRTSEALLRQLIKDTRFKKVRMNSEVSTTARCENDHRTVDANQRMV